MYLLAKRTKGYSVENVRVVARDIWRKANNGTQFVLEHAWNVLRDYDKWTDNT